MLAPVVATSPWITVELPSGLLQRLGAGVFFLARAEDGDATSRAFDVYLRRVLYPVRIAARGTSIHVALAPAQRDDALERWLGGLAAGDTIDLLGPLGNGFAIAPQTRALLIACDADHAALFLPLADTMLDRGGRVVLLARAQTPEAAAMLRLLLPIAVEIRVEVAADFEAALGDLAGWADQIVLCVDGLVPSALLQTLRRRRFRIHDDYAQVLTRTPLPCGSGACLACLVPLANGSFTRACQHGPVFALRMLGDV